MPRNQLAIQDITDNGMTAIPQAADPAGHSLPNDGRTWVNIQNSGGSAVTVSIPLSYRVDGMAPGDRQVVVPAGAARMVGPFPGLLYDQPGNLVYFDFTSVTGVTIAALRLSNSQQQRLFPPDSHFTNIAATPALSRPAYLSPASIDPAFNSRIVRISDQAAFGTASRTPRHTYSTKQPWSADGAYIMMTFDYPSYLVDGKTYAYISTFHPPSSPAWMNTLANAKWIIGTANTNQLVKSDVTGADFNRTVLHTFTGYDSIDLGAGTGNTSNDDQYACARLTISGTYYLVTYNIITDTVIATLNLGTTAPDWYGMSQTGSYVIVLWTTTGTGSKQGTELYDRNLNFIRQVSSQSPHGDLGIDSSGNEVWVGMGASGGLSSSIYMARLSDGVKTTVIDNAPGVQAGHLSCRNLNRPGWVYYSTAGLQSNTWIGRDEIAAIKLDGSQTVERYCHEHHVSGLGYEYEPHACPNQEGTKVLFASPWDGLNTDPSYDYVVTV